MNLQNIANQVHRPGMETFIRLQTSSSELSGSQLIAHSAKNIYLGKVCCKNSCQCNLIRMNSTDFFQNELVKLVDLTPHIPDSAQLHGYYDCSDETLSCMRSCRLALGQFFQNEAFGQYEKKISTSTLDLFSKFENGISLCSMIGKLALDPGQNIYLRYRAQNSNQQADFMHLTEDLHVGRMCCKEFFDTFSPNNKCKT